jgi:hypothetical protein
VSKHADLAKQLSQALQEYTEDITESVKSGVDQVAKETDEEIRSHIIFQNRTGKYVKSFRITETEHSRYRKVKVWHVTNGRYRLTHLLENGHALRAGGRARAFPHIRYGEALARKRMEEIVTEAAAKGGK